MRDLGYLEGREYVIEARQAGGQMDRLPTYARELVDLPVDVIVAGGEASIRAAKRATSQIPIVMTLAADPVGSGLVDSRASRWQRYRHERAGLGSREQAGGTA